MFQSKEIAALKASLDEAQTALATSNASLAEAQAELASAASVNAAIAASAAETAAALATAEAAAIAADARAVAAEAAVETQVIERLASAGVDPIKRDPSAKEGHGKTLTRAEFDALDHSARNAFIANAGKVTE